MFGLGDIVYAKNYCGPNYGAITPAIIVHIKEDDGNRWYRVTFFDNDELYWYEECEVSKNGNT